MSDDEDYNSEEDQDYVPSEGEQVSEEENSGDDEDLSVLQDDDTSESKATKKRKKSAAKKNVIEARKRKGGIKLQDKNSTVSADDSEVIESEEEIKRKKELAEQIAKEEEERKKEKEKKRADDLWSSFMSGVKPPPRASTGSGTTVEAKSASEGARTVPESQTEKAKKVTITKVFDFAGETIKVTKEVDADSKEAKAEQKKQETANQETANPADPLPTSSLSQGLKRPAVGGGLGSVLNKINKKNKMGTLEKSKIDWESFKKKEGIDDDLKIYNKGKQGYTERMAFLNRADQRQYEIERNLRLGSTSKR